MQSLSTVLVDRNRPLTHTVLGMAHGQLFVYNETLYMYLGDTRAVVLSGECIGSVGQLRAKREVPLVTGQLTYRYLYPGDED